MKPASSNPYLKTKILTASPEELRMMLFDGAIKFCHQAKAGLEKQDFEASYNSLMRAQKIVLELSTSLNHDVAPEICQKLSALYTYIYRRLIDANTSHDPAAIDEALELLDYEKQTWKMLVEQVTQNNDGASHPTAQNVDSAQQTAMSSLSING